MSKSRRNIKKHQDEVVITNILPQPIIQSNTLEFESLSKFLDTNRDDPLHNSIYYCLKNASLLSASGCDQSEIIFNIMKIPTEQQQIIMKLFKDRINDIKMRKQIEMNMTQS